MPNTERSISMLTVHRDNLLVAKTFEEYRDVHVAYVAYVEMLIEQFKADQAKDESVHRWMVKTDLDSSTITEALINAKSSLTAFGGDPRKYIADDGSIQGDEIQAAVLDGIDAALASLGHQKVTS